MQNFAYLYDLHFASTKYQITMVEHNYISEISHMTRTMLKYLTLSNRHGYITAVQITS